MQRKDLNQHCLLCDVATALCLLLFWGILLRCQCFAFCRLLKTLRMISKLWSINRELWTFFWKWVCLKMNYVCIWLYAMLCSTACNLEEAFPVLPWLTPLRRCWAGAWIHLSQSSWLDIQKWWFMHFKCADREVSLPVISPGWCFVKFLISAPLSLFWSASHWIYSLIPSKQVKRSQVSCAWQSATVFLLTLCL